MITTEKIIKLAMIVLTVTSLKVCAEVVTVVAEGKAAGDSANMREQALVDALREAVRKGAGTEVLSSTKVKDFVMEYDRVLASAFGYVRNYTVLEAGLGNDEIYRVKIRAEVGEGNPDVKDKMALQMVVRAKGAPRVALEVDELIEGVPAGSGFAQAWFEQTSKDMQMQMVDVSRKGRHDDKLAARDKFYGDTKTSDLRRLDISQDVDFILQARVRGSHIGQNDSYGVKINKFAFSVDLRAIRPDTGYVVASAVIPSKELSSRLASVSDGARDVLHKMLEASDGGDGGWLIYRKVFANWIAELDLGTIMSLEFKQITNAEFDRVQKALSGTSKITSVWPREFDSRGLSFIDVESRLDASGLNKAVRDGLDDAFQLDRSTKSYLQFIRDPVAEPPTAPSPGPNADTVDISKSAPNVPDSPVAVQNSVSGLPAWTWALIGAGIVMLLVGAYSMGKRKG